MKIILSGLQMVELVPAEMPTLIDGDVYLAAFGDCIQACANMMTSGLVRLGIPRDSELMVSGVQHLQTMSSVSVSELHVGAWGDAVLHLPSVTGAACVTAHSKARVMLTRCNASAIYVEAWDSASITLGGETRALSWPPGHEARIDHRRLMVVAPKPQTV